jgi:adenylate/guanylate cyclase family protein
VKRTGDGRIIQFPSVVHAVRCAIEVQNDMVERNAGLPPERRIEFRVGIHLDDVVEESDGDLMGDGVNVAARLEGVAKPGAICLSEDAYRQMKPRFDHRCKSARIARIRLLTAVLYSAAGLSIWLATSCAYLVTSGEPNKTHRVCQCAHASMSVTEESFFASRSASSNPKYASRFS